MSIQKYRAFLTVADQKSLTKAANILGYTQPGISLMVSSLEEELGIQLLLRGKSGVSLTEEAKHLLPHMQQIVSSENTLREASNQLKGIEIGSLNVGGLLSVCTKWFPSIVSAYLTQHPRIDLRIFEGTYGEIQSWLMEGKIDLAINSYPPPNNFDFLPLWEDPILAVLSRENPLSHLESIDLQQMIQYPFIIPNTGADETIQYVLKQENLEPTVRFRIKGDIATLSMIAQNLGVSLIPELAIIPCHPNIVTRPLKKPYFRTLGISARSFKHMSYAAHAFILLVKEFIQGEKNHQLLCFPHNSSWRSIYVPFSY